MIEAKGTTGYRPTVTLLFSKEFENILKALGLAVRSKASNQLQRGHWFESFNPCYSEADQGPIRRKINIFDPFGPFGFKTCGP